MWKKGQTSRTVLFDDVILLYYLTALRLSGEVTSDAQHIHKLPSIYEVPIMGCLNLSADSTTKTQPCREERGGMPGNEQ